MSITAIPWSGPCLLWRVDLDAAPAPAALACLSAAERERAERFVFPRDAARFVAAHAALRQLLAARTGIAAERLVFVEGPFGKPTLAEPTGLHFNLSHSQSQALIAVSHDAELGVDIELERAIPDAFELAATCFSSGEIAQLRAAPAGERDRAFLRGWTRKEACIKALGVGMSMDLPALHVGLESADREVECQLADGRRSLQLTCLDIGDGALGALAMTAAHADNEGATPTALAQETTA